MPDYTPFEMISYTGSRVLQDNKIVFVGTGLPMIAAMHAQLTHAPGLGLIFEAGAYRRFLISECLCLSVIPEPVAKPAS